MRRNGSDTRNPTQRDLLLERQRDDSSEMEERKQIIHAERGYDPRDDTPRRISTGQKCLLYQLQARSRERVGVKYMRREERQNKSNTRTPL